jgi:hypothetical protein
MQELTTRIHPASMLFNTFSMQLEMNLVLSHGYTGKGIEGARAVLDETLMKCVNDW